jgi:formyl-CoA transferase/CoA:oxalate CoA-transferase
MFAAYGVSLALLARERSGKGQEVDLGMLDAVTALLTYQAGSYFASGNIPQRLGNRHPSIAPYETFAASDGDFVIAVGNDALWKKFCAVTGLDAQPGIEQFATNQQRVTEYHTLRPLIAAALTTRSRDCWIEQLTAAGVPCGSVRNLEEVFRDDQVRAREMVAFVEHQTIGALEVLGVPVKLSATPGAVRTPPPLLGQHTEPILAGELGLDPAAIARLREQRVI